MKKELMEQFLHEFKETLSVYYFHWMIDHSNLPKEELKLVGDFVLYIIDHADKDIIEPRRGGSYADVAEKVIECSA